MERRRLTPEQQLACIRDVKLGMSRVNAMKKWGIRHHSTLSQIISRRGHQVKINRPPGTQLIAANGHLSHIPNQTTAAATVLNKARADARLRCIIRQPTGSPVASAATSSSPSHSSHVPQALTATGGSNGFQPKLTFRLTIPQAHRMSTGSTLEQKIDEAIGRLSKLNQKLIVRRGTKVFCKCCNRDVNIRHNTVVARVYEHSMTRSHNEMIGRTRHLRQQESLAAGESLTNGSSDSDKSQQSDPAVGIVPPVVPRLNRRKRQVVRTVVPNSSSVILTQVPTAEQKASRQAEFQRDMLQTFLETGVPIHKLNMDPMRNFLNKWTGMRVPRYEEKSHEYGF